MESQEIVETFAGSVIASAARCRAHVVRERTHKLRTIPLIIAALTDAQMLQFMGRENGED